MRTRCPQCDTVFRVTPEQLRFRAGKVRCGHCQAVFNALDTLIEEAPVPPPSAPSAAPAPAFQPEPAAPAEPESAPTAPEAAPELARQAEAIPAEVEPAPAVEEPAPAPEAPTPGVEEPAPLVEEPEPAAEEPETEGKPEPAVEMKREGESERPAEEEPEAVAAPPAPPAEEAAAQPDETPEESTLAAREAGLVAARELAETPGYNRWAAGTLASSPLGGLEAEGRQRLTWPFALAAVLLAIVLAAQLAYHFRTGIVQRLPEAAALFTALGADIPLPRDANLVSIEASDLQADTARGLLVLQATLKNRAPYAQAWPALELTLTDTRDAVVARRVLHAADYLPPGADPATFAANSETAIRLWIEAKDVAAAGYRLYVFYP